MTSITLASIKKQLLHINKVIINMEQYIENNYIGIVKVIKRINDVYLELREFIEILSYDWGFRIKVEYKMILVLLNKLANLKKKCEEMKKYVRQYINCMIILLKNTSVEYSDASDIALMAELTSKNIFNLADQK